MPLPLELLTLVFLAGLTTVNAQVEEITAPTYITTPADITTPTYVTTPTDITTSDVSSIVATPTAALPLSPTGDSNDIGAPAPTPTTEESPQVTEVEACDLPDPPEWCHEPPPDFWHPEESATGWDDWASWNPDGIGGGNNLLPPSSTLKPVEQTPDVITTVKPSVIEIRTSVEPSAVKPTLADGGATPQPQAPDTAPVGDGHTEKQEPPAQQTPGRAAPQTNVVGKPDTLQGTQVQENPVVPTSGYPVPPASAPGVLAPGPSPAGSKPDTEYEAAQGQSASTGNALLDTIINHLGNAHPGAQPAQPAQSTQPNLPTTGGVGDRLPQESAAASAATARVGPGESAQGWEIVSGHATQGPADAAASQASIAVGNTITLGSATISLTAGLSIVIGSGTDTTLIAIQTDSASHTIITVSSSGTAVTATITDAPTTVTLPKTGFEASITDNAGSGVATSRVAVTAVSTSSKGVANERNVNIGGLSGCVAGILGFVALL